MDNKYRYVLFFFFKQKTAYEMLRSLVGSEMCIRDRPSGDQRALSAVLGVQICLTLQPRFEIRKIPLLWVCLLYTSDAADDLLCVDLGGRRILKKKT